MTDEQKLKHWFELTKIGFNSGLSKYLKSDPWLLNAKNKEGFRAIHFCIAKDNIKTLALLVRRNADLLEEAKSQSLLEFVISRHAIQSFDWLRSNRPELWLYGDVNMLSHIQLAAKTGHIEIVKKVWEVKPEIASSEALATTQLIIEHVVKKNRSVLMALSFCLEAGWVQGDKEATMMMSFLMNQYAHAPYGSEDELKKSLKKLANQGGDLQKSLSTVPSKVFRGRPHHYWSEELFAIRESWVLEQMNVRFRSGSARESMRL